MCPPPLPLTSPSWWLFNQIHLSPSLGQSHHIQTRGRGEEGDRRRRDHLRDISVSDRHPSWSFHKDSREKVTGLLSTCRILSWILYRPPQTVTVLCCHRLKEQACAAHMLYPCKATGRPSHLAFQIWTKMKWDSVCFVFFSFFLRISWSPSSHSVSHRLMWLHHGWVQICLLVIYSFFALVH